MEAALEEMATAQASAQATAQQSALLHWLAGSSRPDAASNVERLLSMDVPTDTRDIHGFTAMASAARVGDASVVKVLLEHGASANLPTRDNENPPLFWAASNGHEAIARLLLAGNADPAQRNVQGDTVLLWACRGGEPSLVALLLEAAPELLTVANNAGFTALICAAAGGHAATLQLLLERAPEKGETDDATRDRMLYLEAKEAHGRSALHFAAASATESHACVKALLDAGADWRVRSDAGLTALGEAEKAKSGDAASLLRTVWMEAADADISRSAEDLELEGGTGAGGESKKVAKARKRRANAARNRDQTAADVIVPAACVEEATEEEEEEEGETDVHMAVAAPHNASAKGSNGHAAVDMVVPLSTALEDGGHDEEGWVRVNGRHREPAPKRQPAKRPTPAPPPPAKVPTPQEPKSQAPKSQAPKSEAPKPQAPTQQAPPPRAPRPPRVVETASEPARALPSISEETLAWQSFASRQPSLVALDVQLHHMLGADLDSLSMAQVSELLEVQRKLVGRLEEARLITVRRQEREVVEERMIQTFERIQIHEREAQQRLQEQQQLELRAIEALSEDS